MRYLAPAPGLLRATFALLMGAIAAPGEARGEPSVDGGYSLAPVPGSRLVPVFLAADDESRQFVGWFDRARGEDCSFAVSGDGVMRCLPTDRVQARHFADASCKQRIAIAPSCSVPRYLVESEPSACTADVRHHVRELGARLHPPTVYASEVNGACTRVPIDPTMMYVRVGPEVRPDSFVAARYAMGRPKLFLKAEYPAGGPKAAPSDSAGGPKAAPSDSAGGPKAAPSNSNIEGR
jgi:hypothetical protein